MRIEPDTKDALLFMVGLLGIISQAVLAAFGLQPSWALLATFSTMCGLALAPSVLRRPSDDDSDRPTNPDRRAKKRARK